MLLSPLDQTLDDWIAEGMVTEEDLRIACEAVTMEALQNEDQLQVTEQAAAILARLTSGKTSVTELAGPFRISLPAISKHLKVLEQAGLITRGREAQWRPCRLDARPLKEVAGWVEEYPHHWDGSFDRLELYLDKLKKAGSSK